MKLITYKKLDGAIVTGCCQCVAFMKDFKNAELVEVTKKEFCPNCGEWDLNEENDKIK